MTAGITLIVALAENGVIGKGGMLPWRIPEDLKRFKRLTMGKPCIMGRKTWDTLPRKPLPGRTNIVVTRNARFRAEGAKIAHSLDQALALARSESADEIMILGGEAIYAEALPRANSIQITEVSGAFDGDAFFPAFDRNAWHESVCEGPFRSGELVYRFVTLERSPSWRTIR